MQILANPYWSRYANNLWFVPGWRTDDRPLVVFYDDLPRDVSPSKPQSFDIIGDTCGLSFLLDGPASAVNIVHYDGAHA